ncbi:MAG: hypothetical protein KME20_13220 [Kaiparowitsia implicata GSE-PSE-MK54-09C]|jgi:hypothetical protein|nr:hypothetical protein [Kaiparowitsia implicata GSE-PSE-MK54-09C]
MTQTTEKKRPPLIIIVLALGVAGAMVMSGQPTQQSAPGAQIMPMLQDPEAEYHEWEYEVWASSPEQAASKCRQAAEQQGLTTFHENSVKQVTRRPSQYGEYLYKCSMSSEVYGEPHYVPDHSNP